MFNGIPLPQSFGSPVYQDPYSMMPSNGMPSMGMNQNMQGMGLNLPANNNFLNPQFQNQQPDIGGLLGLAGMSPGTTIGRPAQFNPMQMMGALKGIPGFNLGFNGQ